MGQQDDNTTPYPHYDRCANCTKLFPKMNQCSRCKIVKYCSRDCQSSHWKKVHKESCTKAIALPLYKIMNGNDGFYMSPEECRALQMALSKDETIDIDKVIQCFQAYFDIAADLGGCFVLWGHWIEFALLARDNYFFWGVNDSPPSKISITTRLTSCQCSRSLKV